ncbi:MAG: iron complex outermembrane receptor protein [Candidatus Azotimanducaceae bacterium]|jgi:iron complex outermembrane receptor protein
MVQNLGENMHKTKLLLASSLLLIGALPTFIQAAESVDLEEVVVTGTRKEGLSPTETLSPVDVFSGRSLSNQATFDMTDGLAKLSPSINTQRFPIADGTAFIRPVTLRNLSPDHTLVLVNGTRRHRSPLVNLQLAPLGTVNQGAQAVDYSALPAAAIKRVEVLRDGAAAQYGSDAIAGVINVILKDADEGISIAVQTGEYFENDGERTSISLNGGLSLWEKGFINGTLEVSTADITNRGKARPDAAAVATIVGPGLVPLDGFGQRWGDPDVESTKLFINTGYDINETLEVYGNFSYSENETVSDFFYRGPVLDPVNMTTARDTLQVDADGDFLPDAAPQTLIDSITGSGLDPADYLVADGTSASGFVLRNPIFTLFPGGYNPNFGADLEDYAVVIGTRGELSNGLQWDVKIRSAESEADYRISETINPSLGRLSPTNFKPGTLTQEETSVNLDFVTEVELNGLASPLNVAFGYEWRDETYKIGAGDVASIQAGPTAAFFGVGSDGFQGFPVESAGSFESESNAVYVDFETNFSDKLSAGLAIRYEDFDEFDSTSDFKVSARYAFTDAFAIRATANSGFRVPTPGQVNTLNVTTTSDTSGNLIPNGTYPVSNPIALTLGAIPLEPEESISFTLGMSWVPTDNFSLTLDYYDIEIDDRLALLNNTVTAAEVTLLTNAGIPNANLLLGSSANFFVNGYDSEIHGFDVAAIRDFDTSLGQLTFDLRHNFNEQKVSGVRGGTINRSRIYDLENQVPENRTTLTISLNSDGMFNGLVRFNNYSDWSTTGGLFSPGDASDQYDYEGAVIVDLEGTLTFNENYRVTLGAENVFDELPDREQDPTLDFLGVTRALTSPWGFNGGFWYLRLAADF